MRPAIVPKWAYDAAGGAIVQPPSGLAAAGYATETRPPAQYFNFHFNALGAWVDFLRGPNLANWTRTAHGGTATGFAGVDVDTYTEDTTTPIPRWVVGITDGTGPCFYVSATGHSWALRRTLPGGATGDLAGVRFLDAWWFSWTDGGPELYYCQPTGGDGITDVAGVWSTVTFPAGVADAVVAMARHPVATGCFVALTGASSLQTVDGPAGPWYEPVESSARTGIGLDIVHDGTSFIYITDDGEAFVASDAYGFAFTKVGVVLDLTNPTQWRLATDGAGTVLAYRRFQAAAEDCYVSTDHGATWTVVAPSASFKNIGRVASDGSGGWVATSTSSPLLLSSNDLETWVSLPAPYVSGDGTPLGVVYGLGRWMAAGQSHVLVSGVALDVTPGGYTPDTVPAILTDAGYLRGYRVASAAPSAGRVLTWNATSSQWEPGAGPITTRGDIFVGGAGGAPSRLAIGGANAVLSTDGTDHVWRTLSAALDAAMGDTRGMILVRGSSDWEPLLLGDAGEVLTSDGTDAAWEPPAGGAGDVDTYDMSSSTGITLTSDGTGTTARTAEVTSGVLRLTVANGATSAHAGGFTDPPWASVPVTDGEGRHVPRGRVRARLASAVGGPSGAYQTRVMLVNDAGTERVGVSLYTFSGTLRLQPAALAAGSWVVAGSFPSNTNLGAVTTGTVWVELEWADEWVVIRSGIGADAVTAPTTWTERARVGLTLSSVPTRWSSLRVACEVPATGHGGLTYDWDDLVVERL